MSGDDCKQELIITDDILAVLDMLDKDIGRQPVKQQEKIQPMETTTFPAKYETLITPQSIETDLTINNSLSNLNLLPTSTLLPAIIKASDPSTMFPSISSDEDIDYSDFVCALFKKIILF